MRDRDPLGYYAAMNVGPGASAEEIRLSYEFFKQSRRAGQRPRDLRRMLAAYETLSDPKTRADYDAGRIRVSVSAGEAFGRARPWLGSTLTLGLSVLVLLVVVGGLFGPALFSELKSYSPGDELVWKAGRRALGNVVSFEERHLFPNGAVAPAYEIRSASGATPVWYPVSDLKRHARRAEHRSG